MLRFVWYAFSVLADSLQHCLILHFVVAQSLKISQRKEIRTVSDLFSASAQSCARMWFSSPKNTSKLFKALCVYLMPQLFLLSFSVGFLFAWVTSPPEAVAMFNQLTLIFPKHATEKNWTNSKSLLIQISLVWGISSNCQICEIITIIWVVGKVPNLFFSLQHVFGCRFSWLPLLQDCWFVRLPWS